VRRFAAVASVSLALLVGAMSTVHAEGYAGFRAGGTMASFAGPDADLFPGSRNGFTGGAFLGFDSGQRLGFRADVLYTMKGAINGDQSFKLDYIELGTMLVARFRLSERFGLRAFAGPMVGVFVNAEFDSGAVDVDLGDIVSHWEISGTIGAELDVKAGPYFVLFEARYTQGSRIFEDKNLAGEPLDFNVSNSGLAGMAGLMIPFR
jgi:Outer membrane protein beta-barrel domain